MQPSKKSSSHSFVFFGSGPVAAKSLDLLKDTFAIEAIITKPSTEREMSSACPEAPLFTVSNNKELEAVIAEQAFGSKACILIDFGIIVSHKVIDSFEKGIINSHFSILPELKGADPISFAILEGKGETGVSLMLVTEAMDAGDVFAQQSILLDRTETTPTLTETLIQLSYQMLRDNLGAYMQDTLKPKDQNEWQQQSDKVESFSRKLTKSDGILDWTKDADILEREVRAYSGWPKSRTSLGDMEVVITKAHVMPNEKERTNPSTLLIDAKAGGLAIECGDGNYLCIEQLIPAGKKEMPIDAFLRGYASRIQA